MRALLLTLALAFLAAPRPAPAEARPWPCLPPIFDGGERLHPLPSPRVLWLQLLLRQHEICWRQSHDLRVGVFGNSAVYGFPLEAEECFISDLNHHLREVGIPAHLFNLGFVWTYQIKDAVILHEALPYDLDVIVLPLTLADFPHVAPLPFPATVAFFKANLAALSEMNADRPRGLEDPIERYATYYFEIMKMKDSPLERMREGGKLLRAALKTNAQWVQEKIHSPPGLPDIRLGHRQPQYDCEATRKRFARNYADWQDWDITAELQHLKESRGIEVLIVDWPIAHEPVGSCYNFRYPAEAIAEFSTWLAARAEERGLYFLDLHRLLAPEYFLDSLHVTPEGHQRIAEAMQPTLDAILRSVAERRAGTADR